jgi:hypothetical protein
LGLDEEERGAYFILFWLTIRFPSYGGINHESFQLHQHSMQSNGKENIHYIQFKIGPLLCFQE